LPRIVADLGPPLSDEGDPPIVVFGTQEFECIREAPAGALLLLARSRSRTNAVVAFIEMVLTDQSDAEIVRLHETLAARDPIVRVSAVEKVFDELVDYYTARPTRRSTSSHDGPQATGTTSTGDSDGQTPPAESAS